MAKNLKRKNTSTTVEPSTDEKSFVKGKKPFKGKGKHRTDGKPAYLGHNSISWYSQNPDMFRDSSMIPFSEVMGLPLTPDPQFVPEDPGPTPGVISRDTRITQPGFMRIGYAMTLGRDTLLQDGPTPLDAINVASQKIYAWVRHANSGSRNYDASDLMMYLMNAANVYARYVELMRAYSYAYTYNTRNRYLPDAILTGLGFFPNSLQENLAQCRLDIEYIRAKLVSFAVPKTMPLFQRAMWMNEFVYMDCVGEKAMYYAFVPDVLYNYSGFTAETGSELIAKPRPKLVNFHEYATQLSMEIDAILKDEDVGIYSGDIQKAYTDSELFQFPAIPLEFNSTPIYNADVAMAIQNGTLVGEPVTTGDSWNIKQFNNVLGQTTPVKRSDKGLYTTSMLNVLHAVPTPDEVILYTRFKAVIAKELTMGSFFTGVSKANIQICDIFVLTEITLLQNTGYKLRVDEKRVDDKFELLNYTINSNYVDVENSDSWRSILHKSQIECLPILMLGKDNDKNDATMHFLGYSVDTQNYTLIDAVELAKLHGTAILSQFNVNAVANKTFSGN